MFVEVRRVDPSQWRELRDIRLRALADAPYAYATTYEESVARPDSYWHGMAAAPAWVACREDGRWVGLVRAAVEAEGVAQLLSMWVDPAARQAGVGRALVGAVVAWAREQPGVTEVRLWVVEDNPAAHALYRASGFVPTGARQPVPSAPARMELEMRRELARPRPERPTASRRSPRPPG
jgi:RimJ/RimL family protein N-acetyltransferase